MVTLGPRSYSHFSRPEADEIATLFTPTSPMFADVRHMAFTTAPNPEIQYALDHLYQQPRQEFPTHMIFDNSMYPADGGFVAYGGGRTSSTGQHEDAEQHMAQSNLSSASAASAASAASSSGGSPRSGHGQPAHVPEWAGPQHLMSPAAIGPQDFFGGGGTEYSFAPQEAALIQPEMQQAAMPFENPFAQPHGAPYSHSPSLQSASPHVRQESTSPFLPPNAAYQYTTPPYPQPPTNQDRRQSLTSFHSAYSGEQQYSDSETKEKQRCPHPECGKVFKDLKAHMLTHQTERPEKCPIQTCEYHVKGFARKYDKNRHTLTHYKGTMVCGFCPGSGSAAEKSFNRADVFKRHLTAVHGVEQTPPNSRKKTSSVASSAGSASGGNKLVGYAPDATGKCSTCSQTFSNAQDFYEHLDDCVLRIVQQEDPAEAVNEARLAEVEDDKEVHETLDKAGLPRTTIVPKAEDADDDEMNEDEDSFAADDDSKTRSIKTNSSSPGKKVDTPSGASGNGVTTNTNPNNGKSRGMTHSRGGFPLSQVIGISKSSSTASSRGRRHRKDFPTSWGFDKGQMSMKKRVMSVFDGPRRLAKDDMMLSMEHEVRIRLADGKSYVTDLDVQTLKRADGFWGATEEERGIWVSDDPTEEDLKIMLDAQMAAA